MSVTWLNVYSDVGAMLGLDSPRVAQALRTSSASWLRVEQRWNGQRLMPCVGMRAEQASHVIDSKDFQGRDWYLVSRQDLCIHIWSAPGENKTSACIFCHKVRP